MITCIKLKNHKGIKEFTLTNLGHINVICGRNNSGKSSTIEAIHNKDTHAFGKIITQQDYDLLVKQFDGIAIKYTNPSPYFSNNWFQQKLKQKIGTAIYEDEVEALHREFGESFQKESRHGLDTFNFKNLFGNFLKPKDFTVVLIPAKRELLPKTAVGNVAASVGQGMDILSRLFALGTKNNRTPEYIVNQEIKTAFSDITDGCKFHTQISDKNQEIEIQFLNARGEWIGADDSGLGLRDILVILHYVLDTPFTSILVEEPESHIHPDMQRKLLKFLSTRANKQFFFTTHSSVFLDPTYVNKVIYVEAPDGEVIASDETNKANVLANLGYSIVDNLVSDLVVLTEGPYDIPVIKEICDKLGFLHKHNIKFYPLGGDIMHHVDLSVFREKNKVVAIVDSDPGSRRVRDEFKNICEKNGVEFHKLERYAIENYFSIRAIKHIYPNHAISLVKDQLKPDEKVEKQLGFSVKSRSREIAHEMSLDELSGTDLLEYCKSIGTLLIECMEGKRATS